VCPDRVTGSSDPPVVDSVRGGATVTLANETPAIAIAELARKRRFQKNGRSLRASRTHARQGHSTATAALVPSRIARLAALAPCTGLRTRNLRSSSPRVRTRSAERIPRSLRIFVGTSLDDRRRIGCGPQFIIRDRDDKLGAAFDRVAAGAGARAVQTAVRAPLMNAVCERFLGSVRRECLDQVTILSERHLRHVLAECALS
jgi:transposase InsO family protein